MINLLLQQLKHYFGQVNPLTADPVKALHWRLISARAPEWQKLKMVG